MLPMGIKISAVVGLLRSWPRRLLPRTSENCSYRQLASGVRSYRQLASGVRSYRKFATPYSTTSGTTQIGEQRARGTRGLVRKLLLGQVLGSSQESLG